MATVVCAIKFSHHHHRWVRTGWINTCSLFTHTHTQTHHWMKKIWFVFLAPKLFGLVQQQKKLVQFFLARKTQPIPWPPKCLFWITPPSLGNKMQICLYNNSERWTFQDNFFSFFNLIFELNSEHKVQSEEKKIHWGHLQKKKLTTRADVLQTSDKKNYSRTIVIYVVETFGPDVWRTTIMITITPMGIYGQFNGLKKKKTKYYSSCCFFSSFYINITWPVEIK